VPAETQPGHVGGTPAGGWLSRGELLRPLPATTDVLVVGGGLAGASLAYYLARLGVEVVLVERGELNREASGTNAGSFHFQIAIHQLTGTETAGVRDRLEREVRLHAEAAEVWQTLERDLGGDLDLHITGGLMVAETEDELRLLHEKSVIEEAAGLDVTVLEGEELRSFAPFLAEDLLGATFCAQEGHADPARAAPLFALRAAQAGAVIRIHADVAAVAADPDAVGGRFTVTTSAGRIRAHRLVNAAGAWANDLAALTGLTLPLWIDGLHLNVTEPREHVLGPMVQHIGRRLTLKQTTHNTFIIGGGWPARPEPPPHRYSTRWDSMAGNVAVAVRVVPLLADVRIVRTWSGVMAFTNDLTPVVGESRRLPGYHALIATTGFTLSPLMGRLLAETMATGRDLIPPEFAVDRSVATPHST
jgi:sarcosine oxidase, subunit beta